MPLTSFSFSQSLASVADCVPLPVILALQPKVAKKLAEPDFTAEEIEVFGGGIGGTGGRLIPVFCWRRARVGYGNVEGTSVVEISAPPGVKSIVL
jgi:hypothetical protein